MWKIDTLPADYRWLSPVEDAVAPDGLPDVIQVKANVEWISFINDEGKADVRAEQRYAYAIPAMFPVMVEIADNGTVYDCIAEFDEHTEHKDCLWIIQQMRDPFGDFDFTYYDIPSGTPDSWIPDNPDDNGMRMSDFI